MGKTIRLKNYAKWRTLSLFSVYFLFLFHFLHWKFNGTTLAPLELNEVLYTIHQGIITAGFILMLLVMVLTLIFGRFFCSWACHILALQDACAWLMKKLKIKPRVIRSRLLLWIPFGAVFYLFMWPQLSMLMHGIEVAELRVVAEEARGGWSSFVTDNFWRNLPPTEIALLTFFICGFLLVYMLGSRSFCYYGCPYGALFGIADQFAPARITLTGNCIQCGLCTTNCSSDILVHKEIKEFGMVTNPRCMKDLDCVGNCPEQAIKVKFRKPPLFRKKYSLSQYKHRYSFTLVEDIAMMCVFLISMFIYRGLYDLVPFLMAIGISITSGYFTIVCYRMVKKMSVKVGAFQLKVSNKLTLSGFVFVLMAFLFYVFTIHSSYVHFHNYVGQQSYNTILEHQQGQLISKNVAPNLVRNALDHFETAYNAGFLIPLDLRKQMASLYLLTGNIKKGEEQLNSILEVDPSNLEALYRYGILSLDRDQPDKAKHYFSTCIIKDNLMSTERDFKVRGGSALELGKIYDQSGKVKKALECYTQSISDDSTNVEAYLAISSLFMRIGNLNAAINHLRQGLNLRTKSALIHNNLGALYAQTNQPIKAIDHFEAVLQNGVDNVQVRYNLGMLYFGKGQLTQSAIHLSEAIRQKPDYLKAQKAYVMVMNTK